MNKKIIILTILAIFLTATIFSSSVMAIDSYITIETDSQIDQPMTPGGSTEEIEITIGYKINYTLLLGFSKFFIFKSKIGRRIIFGDEFKILKTKDIPPAIIELELTNVPKWCTASLDKHNVSIEIRDEYKEAKAKLTVSLDIDAPAFDPTDITIKAEFKNENWKIAESSNETTITVEADYLGMIDIGLAYNYMEIPPLNETTIPINITNLGNAKTKINSQILNKPTDWNITLPETTLNVDETKQIDLIVQPPEEFDNETIKIKFTPQYYDDETKTGNTQEISIFLQNDGSLEEENGSVIPGFEIIGILAALTITLIIIKRRKK